METGRGQSTGLTHHIALQGNLGLRDARQVQHLLSEAISESRAVELDVREITDLDISIVQLIAAARKSARQRGGELTLVSHPNSAFTKTVTRAGLLRVDSAVRNADEEFWAGKLTAGGIAS